MFVLLRLLRLFEPERGAAGGAAAVACGRGASQTRVLGVGLSVGLVASLRGGGGGQGGSAINVGRSRAGLDLGGRGPVPVAEEIRVLGREGVIVQELHRNGSVLGVVVHGEDVLWF
ncbi:hypothetical protein PG996_012108 [Apiospora saccharicola]|uniref:Secreted protein n=1 Tax=Apiospora saccharicola TaxID=335842 RepID=A0ABR1U274_9PEZI